MTLACNSRRPKPPGLAVNTEERTQWNLESLRSIPRHASENHLSRPKLTIPASYSLIHTRNAPKFPDSKSQTKPQPQNHASRYNYTPRPVESKPQPLPYAPDMSPNKQHLTARKHDIDQRARSVDIHRSQSIQRARFSLHGALCSSWLRESKSLRRAPSPRRELSRKPKAGEQARSPRRELRRKA